MFNEVMDRFVEQSAPSVMFRGTLENVVTADLLDEIFTKTAKRQRCGELLFSSIVDLLALVTTGSRKSVNHAYQAKKQQFTVSVTAVYDKLNGVETEVSRQLVRQTALRMADVVKRLAPRQAIRRGDDAGVLRRGGAEPAVAGSRSAESRADCGLS